MNSTSLIKLVNSKTRLPLGVFLGTWILVLYMLPQKYQFFTAYSVPITIVDSWVNLNAHWVWIYVSYYFYLAGAFLLARSEQNSNQLFYSFTVSAFVSTLIFFLFPTTIPRELYPLADASTWSGWMLNMIRASDASLNCAPSMHVAMSTMAAGTYLREKTWYRWPAVSWVFFIAYSTMATKQHYWWDVVAGFAFGLITFVIFDRAEYVAPEQSSRSANPNAA